MKRVFYKLPDQAPNAFLVFRSDHTFLAPGQALLLTANTLSLRMVFTGTAQVFCNCPLIMVSKISCKVFSKYARYFASFDIAMAKH